MPTPLGGGLTAKQACFAAEYPTDFNASAAAIRSGYSKRTAAVAGSENLKNPLIAEAIKIQQDARAAALGVTSDRVIAELATIAFADISDDIRPGNKISALDLIGKHLGMYTEKREVRYPDGAPKQSLTLTLVRPDGTVTDVQRDGDKGVNPD